MVWPLLFSTGGCSVFSGLQNVMQSSIGKDMPNFIDVTGRHREPVRLRGDYLLLYQKKDYSDGVDRSYLRFKSTKTRKTFNILKGHLGYDIGHGMIIPEKHLIVFSFSNLREEPYGKTTIRAYDYVNKSFTDETVVISRLKEKRRSQLEEKKLPTTRLSDLVVSKDKDFLGADVVIYNEQGKPIGHISKCFKLVDNKLVRTNERNYKEIKENQDETGVYIGYEFKKGRRWLQAFILDADNDFLAAKYKSQYDGLIIRDKRRGTNLKISKNKNLCDSPMLWLADGSKLINGPYLYDVTGEMKESKLVDGNIISLVKL